MDVPTTSASVFPEKPSNSRKWFIGALSILTIINLIAAVVIAFVLVPSCECDCSASSSSEAAAAAAVEDRYYTEETIEWRALNGSCPTNTVGIINVNQTYRPTSYYGWYLHTSYPEFYPPADIHASVGDTIQFSSWQSASAVGSVWLVPESVYNDCQFTPDSGAVQLAINNDVREDRGGGYNFLIQDWHVREWGEVLYFASSQGWEDPTATRGCQNGMKLKVYVEPREVIPVVDANDLGAFDLTATEVVQDLQVSIGHLSRVLTLQQWNFENRIRSEGDSGITNVRGAFDGEAVYNDGTFSANNALSMHNHANNAIVVGMGEIQAVLNGVEFRTRHNDYNLNMPSRTSKEYHAQEAVPFPDVPPEVTAQSSVQGQIEEMQEWFRAFKTQNTSHRDYPQYFKPILCYLEGAWIDADEELEDAFDSDRHQLDAATWRELHDKVRYMVNSGRKNVAENLAALPSAIRNLVNDTFPIISNWEYRILCAPLSNDVPTSRFRVADDLHIQLLSAPETRDELYFSRQARFELNINLEDAAKWEKGKTRWNYLDFLMEQIPGKDNFVANLTDRFPDGTSLAMPAEDAEKGDVPLNTGFYSRFYRLSEDDAMGSSNHRRGYSDRYLFAAKTSHAQVSPVGMDYVGADGEVYPTLSRWSYAIPLEIVYLTPLSQWNPYGIDYADDDDDFVERNGDCGSQPLVNTKKQMFYRTPASFFGSGDSEEDAADTTQSGICVVDADGNEHGVAASGHWIVFPEIANGVGLVRQRFPIFPVHYAGSLAFKEAKALQDVLIDEETYDDVDDGTEFWTDARDLQYGFNLYLEGGGHDHIVYVSGSRVSSSFYDDRTEQFLNGSAHTIREDSDIANGHTHTVNFYRWRESDDAAWNYELIDCRYGLRNEEDEGYEYQSGSCADFHDSLRRDQGTTSS